MVSKYPQAASPLFAGTPEAIASSGAAAPASPLRAEFTRRGVLAAGAALALGAGAARARSADLAPVDVIVLGAGISGLHAARMLQKEGLTVSVLEGSARVGGRCWSGTDVPGRPEFGAGTVGAGYGRVRANAAELNVDLVPPPPGSRDIVVKADAGFSVYGRPVAALPWADSPLNLLAPQEHKMAPSTLLSHYLAHDAGLDNLTDWLTPEFAWLDKLSLREYFSSLGASREALRLMEAQAPAANLDEANALHFVRRTVYYGWEARAGRAHRVKGGTSALTDAMAASLRQPVQLNRFVRSIRADAKSVEVLCADGTRHRARSAISTIPFAVLKSLRVDGPVAAAQRAGWSALRSTAVVQVYMTVESPFWERDGALADMWSDSPLSRVYHLPSATDPCGILCGWISGDAAKALPSTDPAAIGRWTVAELARMRPASTGQVSVTHVHDWRAQPGELGHMASYQPGDIGRYAQALQQPVGALHFAGDHLGRVHVGLEAACEAGEHAAMAVMDRLL